MPALEIVDSHIELAGRTIVDTVSDNAALGAVVVGDVEITPRDRDFASIGAQCFVNDEVLETGVSGGVLGRPALGVAWLSAKLAEHGDQLEADELILAGSFARPVWVHPGDRVRVHYQDAGTVVSRDARRSRPSSRPSTRRSTRSAPRATPSGSTPSPRSTPTAASPAAHRSSSSPLTSR